MSLRRMLLAVFSFVVALPLLAQTPVVGEVAPNFTLSTPSGKSVSLDSLSSKGTVALVFLRGYPGYQCPFCVKQVHNYIEHAGKLAAAHVSVLFVYPGPPADLEKHAQEALEKQAALPANMVLVTDPDYKATNLYSLRWDKQGETAYPSTFLLNKGGKIAFEWISRAHGDRTTADDILSKLNK